MAAANRTRKGDAAANAAPERLVSPASTATASPCSALESISLLSVVVVGLRESTPKAAAPAVAADENADSGAVRSAAATDSDGWENVLRQLGEDNPEQAVSGIVVQYPSLLVGYLETSEPGLLSSLALTKRLILHKSGGLQRLKVVFINFNIKERQFSSLVSRKLDANLRKRPPGDPAAGFASARAAVAASVFSLVIAVKKQTAVSVKKALDVIGEKSPLLLPDPALVEQALADETMPDPLQQKVADLGRTVLLDEDVVWPVSGEVFNLNIRINTL